ncbi:MAG: TetR/AcrR family transcriptional regulator [Planctomycetota bacterium]
MPASRRQDLLETAARLFAEHGFQAVGIDRILKEAGVAKMTLYKHFASKDDLIREALQFSDQAWQHAFWSAVADRADTPAGRLLAVFDELAAWHISDDYRGCVFMHAASEHLETASPAHSVACDHHQAVRSKLIEMADEAGAADPEALGASLALLFEGANACAQLCRTDNPAKQARDAAATLLRAAELLV